MSSEKEPFIHELIKALFIVFVLFLLFTSR